jgi:hypothetical protein
MEPVSIVDGPQSRAIVQRPPEISRPGAEYATPSFTARVRPDSLVLPGQVLQLGGGDHSLTAIHSATADWRTLHLFRCDRQVRWERPVPITDTLTGLARAGAPPALMKADLWVMWERVRREFTDLNIRIAQERHLVATGADVQLGDLINGSTVDRVSDAMGVNILELKS